MVMNTSRQADPWHIDIRGSSVRSRQIGEEVIEEVGNAGGSSQGWGGG
jgi:hypothetical protein